MGRSRRADYKNPVLRLTEIKLDLDHSEAALKAAGKLRSEGKEYVVADGDIVHFLFNV